MSTFDGILREYPLISIDQFLQKNISSTVFFLSHCHSDHMRGLHSQVFAEHLHKSVSSRIYLSAVSKIFLENDPVYEHLSQFLEAIPIDQPTVICIPKNEEEIADEVVVTLLPAGHCPGSVMFFFEGSKGNVLYTGDFRLQVGHSKRLKQLHYDDGRVKPIKTLYLDTTFCDPKSLFIPSREECLEAILSLVGKWITKSPHHIVYLLCPANFGYEYVFVALSKKLETKVHIKEKNLKKCYKIPEINQAVTHDPMEAKIHACSDLLPYQIQPDIKTACGYYATDGELLNIRHIKLSAMYFTSDVKMNSIVQYNKQKKIYQACYSTHSSLTEIWDLVGHLQPRRLYPNVVPDGKSKKEVLKWISPLVNACISEEKIKIPTLGLLKAFENDDSSQSVGSLIFEYEARSHRGKDDITSKNDDKEKQNLAVVLENDPVCLFEGSSSPSLEKTSSQSTVQERESSELDLDFSNDNIDSIVPVKEVATANMVDKQDQKNSFGEPPKWVYSPTLDDDECDILEKEDNYVSDYISVSDNEIVSSQDSHNCSNKSGNTTPEGLRIVYNDAADVATEQNDYSELKYKGISEKYDYIFELFLSTNNNKPQSSDIHHLNNPSCSHSVNCSGDDLLRNVRADLNLGTYACEKVAENLEIEDGEKICNNVTSSDCSDNDRTPILHSENNESYLENRNILSDANKDEHYPRSDEPNSSFVHISSSSQPLLDSAEVHLDHKDVSNNTYDVPWHQKDDQNHEQGFGNESNIKSSEIQLTDINSNVEDSDEDSPSLIQTLHRNKSLKKVYSNNDLKRQSNVESMDSSSEEEISPSPEAFKGFSNLHKTMERSKRLRICGTNHESDDLHNVTFPLDFSQYSTQNVFDKSTSSDNNIPLIIIDD